MAFGVSHLFSRARHSSRSAPCLGRGWSANVLLRDHPRAKGARRGQGSGPTTRPTARAARQAALGAQQLPDAPGCVFAMMSNHFRLRVRAPSAWLVLLALMALSAWFRHFFNLRHPGGRMGDPRHGGRARGRACGGHPAGGRLVSPPAAHRSLSRRWRRSSSSAARRVTRWNRQTTRSRPLRRESFWTHPNRSRHGRRAIEEQAVETEAMPLGNATGMTDDERELLGRWIAQGAHDPLESGPAQGIRD